MSCQANGVVDHLVSDLAFGRIRSVAFVVPSDVSWTLPLYDLAIATARRGWRIGIEDARYWFVTPEPEPLARLGTAVSVAASERLEPEGITFIGSTYADVRDGLVLLDPQGESIEVDAVVSLQRALRMRLTSISGVPSRLRGGVTAGKRSSISSGSSLTLSRSAKPSRDACLSSAGLDPPMTPTTGRTQRMRNSASATSMR
jgi:hypothetical protein